MIYGVGVDICGVRRIAKTLQKHPGRFARRILGPNETGIFDARTQRLCERGVRYLATRFSAKEAFSKATGLGLLFPMRWADCEILNSASGQPQIYLHGSLAAWCAARCLSFHVSLSDESDYVVGFVVAETMHSNTHIDSNP